MLGVIQIPLGLTLYGSPRALFIVFALAGFGYLLIFLILSYLYDTQDGYTDDGYDSRFSYLSGTSTAPSSHRGRRVAGIAAGTAALAAAFRHRRRDDSRMYDDSRISAVDDEKYSVGPRHSHWGKRLLEIAGVVGLIALAKKYFDSRRRREEDSEAGTYTQTPSMTEDSYSRTDYGPPPDRRWPPPRGRASSVSGSRSSSRSGSGSRSGSPASSYYNSSYMNNDAGRSSHPLRNALAGAGIFAAARNLFGGRKRNEQQRVDDVFRRDAEEERIQRTNSRRYTGDGTHGPRKLRKHPMYNTVEEVSSSESSLQHGGGGPMASGGMRPPSGARPMPPPMPGSSVPSGPPIRPPPGAMAPSSQRYPSGYGESPQSSAKLQMQNGGNNITLRRLTDEEAAASRERKHNRRRRGSASSLSGNEAGADRWRRVEEMERRQDEQIRRERAAAAAAASSSNGRRFSTMGALPPAPPIPSQASYNYPPGSYTSPTFTGTEASGDFAGNRRRRRAERARARQGRNQNSVEFT